MTSSSASRRKASTHRSLALCGTLLAALTLIALPTGPQRAAADTEKPGRYTMKEIDGGFIRLDTLTGVMSTCTKDNNKWACDALPDSNQALRDDVEKLRRKNAELKKEMQQMEEVFGLRDAPADGSKPRGHARSKPQLNLPSEQDVDKAVDYLEGMIRKFRERFEDFGDKTNPRRADPNDADPKDKDSRPL